MQLPKLSNAEWIALAGVVVAVFAFLATIISALITRPRWKAGKAELVHVIVRDYSADYLRLPVLTLTARNASNEVVVLTAVEVQVVDVWPLMLIVPFNAAMRPSANYDLSLDPTEQPPYTRSIAISHSLQPNEADQFTIALSLDPMVMPESIYHLRLRLLFNRGDVTQSKDVVVVLPDASSFHPTYFSADFNKQWAQYQALPAISIRTLGVFQDLASISAEIDAQNRRRIESAGKIEAVFSERAEELIRMAREQNVQKRT